MGEFRSLTGLRIVAALWVVAFHFHFTALSGVERIDAVFGPLLSQGALGVDLFFVLSGFVIAHTYLDQLGPRFSAAAAGRFVWARICRMWPVYALVFHVFGIWLVIRAVFGHSRDIAFQAVQPVLSVGQWLQQLFLVQMWDDAYLDGASWVGPTWSLSAEWLAYLLFPIAALGFFRLRRLPAPLLVAGALALMAPMVQAYVATGNPYYPYSWLVRILCGFGAGVLMCLALRRMRRDEAARRAASWFAAAVPVLIGIGLVLGERLGPGRGGVVIALFPLLVGALALADRGPAMLLARPATIYGGRISYSLYLVHIPLFELYWYALQRYPELLGAHTLLAHVTGLLVLLAAPAAAAVLHRYVEEPARVGLRSVTFRRPALAVPAPRHAASAERRPTLTDLLVTAPARRPRHAAGS